ncbi:MAG: porin [Pseudomonadota bacterium]
MNKTRALVQALVCAGLGSCLLAAEAYAQSQVEVYGLVGAYVGSVKRSGDKSAVTVEGGGGLTTSYLGVRGQEALGGELKTIYALESFLRPDTGEQGRSAADPLFSRNAWIGLAGGFGSVTLGRQTNPTYGVMSRLSPFGSSVVFSPLALQTFVAAYGGSILGDSVWNNTIAYSIPSINGFGATAIYGLGEQANRAGVANLGLHGTYGSGKFMAALSAQRLRINGAAPLPVEQDAYLAGANYDFGSVKVYANAGRTAIHGSAVTRLGDAGVSVPLSAAGSLLAEVARTSARMPGSAQTRRTTASVGYDYRFSRRTDVYAIYLLDRKSSASAAGSTALGIRHLF